MMPKLSAIAFSLAATFAMMVQAQPAPADRADLVVRPDWLKKPDADDLAQVWPAAGRGKDGAATIRCVVNVDGLLNKCAVVSETPLGLGFGAAALLLTPNFRMRPALRNGKVAEGTVSIPIQFKGSGGRGEVYGQKITVMANPAWREAPSSAEVALAYPKKATAPVRIVFRCGLTRDNGVTDCERVTGEQTYEDAARRLLPKFRLLLPTIDRRDRTKMRVNLPIHLHGPEANMVSPERIGEPQWSRVLDPKQVQELFPDLAATAGVKNGRGVAECSVAVGGELENCRAKSEAPAGLGFGLAAVRLVDALSIFPWTTDGRPVDGAKIAVPVQFNLAEPVPAATPPTPPR